MVFGPNDRKKEFFYGFASSCMGFCIAIFTAEMRE